jgi:hypothetical protein
MNRKLYYSFLNRTLALLGDCRQYRVRYAVFIRFFREC